MSPRLRPWSLLLMTAPLLGGCTKPKPPTVVPKTAQVTALDPQGVSIDVTVEMTNPNGFALSVQGITGRVTLEGGNELGEVNVTQPVSLPPGVPTTVKVPIVARWAGMASLGTVVLAGKDVPFTVSGTATVGTPSWNVGVPYSVSGTLTHEQIRRAVTSPLGKLPLPVPLPIGSAPR